MGNVPKKMPKCSLGNLIKSFFFLLTDILFIYLLGYRAMSKILGCQKNYYKITM